MSETGSKSETAKPRRQLTAMRSPTRNNGAIGVDVSARDAFTAKIIAYSKMMLDAEEYDRAEIIQGMRRLCELARKTGAPIDERVIGDAIRRLSCDA